jgi:small subunit ribosomal protein S8
MTDPIADLLTRIRNAHIAKHAEVRMPTSRVKVDIVRILKDEGFVADYSTEAAAAQGTLRIALKYGAEGEPAITGLERISRPGRRVYRGQAEIPKVLNGLGITIVSTSRGILSGAACREAGVGGEVLCTVW